MLGRRQSVKSQMKRNIIECERTAILSQMIRLYSKYLLIIYAKVIIRFM